MIKFFKGIRRAIFGLTAKEKEDELKAEERAKKAAKKLAELFRGGNNPFMGSPKKDTPEQLKALFDSYTNAETFAPGDVVMWKKGLKNKTRPAYGNPAIVVAVDEGAVSDCESSAQYFREKISLCIGITDNDGDLIVYHVDPARFTKYIAQPDAAQESAGTI